jgi:hypothetical protein
VRAERPAEHHHREPAEHRIGDPGRPTVPVRSSTAASPCALAPIGACARVIQLAADEPPDRERDERRRGQMAQERHRA